MSDPLHPFTTDECQLFNDGVLVAQAVDLRMAKLLAKILNESFERFMHDLEWMQLSPEQKAMLDEWWGYRTANAKTTKQ